MPIQGGYAQREALLHLVFPDTFEDTVSREYKARMAEALRHLVPEPSEDVDRLLLQIRQRLGAEHGSSFSFYDPEVRPLWDEVALDPKPWC